MTTMTHGIGKVYKTIRRTQMYILTDSELTGVMVEPNTHMLLVRKQYIKGWGPNQGTTYVRYKFLSGDKLLIVNIPVLGPRKVGVPTCLVPVRE